MRKVSLTAGAPHPGWLCLAGVCVAGVYKEPAGLCRVGWRHLPALLNLSGEMALRCFWDVQILPPTSASPVLVFSRNNIFLELQGGSGLVHIVGGSQTLGFLENYEVPKTLGFTWVPCRGLLC